MHKRRPTISRRIPIEKKGTKYVARALSDVDNSIPVVLAVRDMLKLARTAREVRKMINSKLLKINGRAVKDYRESIKLLNLFTADKTYVLSLLPTGRFALEETKDSSKRLCKIIGKKKLPGNKIQLNLHDGSNVISEKDYPVGDSLYLSLDGKIKEHVSVSKGKEVIISSGKYVGLSGKIAEIKEKNAIVKINNKEAPAELPISQLIVQ